MIKLTNYLTQIPLKKKLMSVYIFEEILLPQLTITKIFLPFLLSTTVSDFFVSVKDWIWKQNWYM